MSESYTSGHVCVEIPGVDVSDAENFLARAKLLCKSRLWDETLLIDPTAYWDATDFDDGLVYETEHTYFMVGQTDGCCIYIYERSYFNPEMAEYVVRELVEYFDVQQPVTATWACYSDYSGGPTPEGNGFIVMKGKPTVWVYLQQILEAKVPALLEEQHNDKIHN